MPGRSNLAVSGLCQSSTNVCGPQIKAGFELSWSDSDCFTKSEILLEVSFALYQDFYVSVNGINFWHNVPEMILPVLDMKAVF